MSCTNDILKELVGYFENTPLEQIKKDWAKTKDFDRIGPTVDSFLTNCTNQNPVADINTNQNSDCSEQNNTNL
jgi:hypothetical protein